MYIDILYYLLGAIMLGVSAAWIYLLKSMAETFRCTPRLDGFDGNVQAAPKISVILPARNEQEFLDGCIDSLANQDYANYEIVAIDDSSTDKTREIIDSHAKITSKLVPVYARPKPKDWIGKNWACMEGYLHSTGELLLFTDADTTHSRSVIRLAVQHLLSSNLDALTVVPGMRALDFWTRVTLPVISVFLDTRFSALNVNDPSKKTGYFFGSFFIIRKEAYQSVGMHEGVKDEIIEDAALGSKVKDAGYKMRMVQGRDKIDAVWARDWSTLWAGMQRLMVPLYLQSKKTAVAILLAVAFLLFVPFLAALGAAIAPAGAASDFVLVASVIASLLVYAGTVMESKQLKVHLLHVVLAPLGCLVIVSGFLCGVIRAGGSRSVVWRDRRYSLRARGRDSLRV